MEDKLLESIPYIIPTVITGCIIYYMFNQLITQQKNENNLAILAKKKKESLQIKLQAYERMLLFCDRINPVKIVVRVKPISENTKDYLELLIHNIEQELEHNLVQQMYITNDSWTAIIAAKMTVINNLKEAAKVANTANALRENILVNYSKTLPPTNTAIDFIKNEVNKLL